MNLIQRVMNGVGRRMVRAASSTGYRAASTQRRLATWQATNQNINSLIVGSGDVIRARSRDLVREDAWVASGIDDWVTEAVGTGGVPHPQHSDPKKRELLADLWSRFADEADATGTMSVYGQQALALRGALEGGETFTRLRARRASDGLTVPLQLQVLEAEHLPLEKNDLFRTRNKIRAGIEFDEIGRRVAYHLYPDHPGDSTINPPMMQTKRVRAHRILHEYLVGRPGQIRGEPKTVRALVKAKQLSRYSDAESEAKALAACMVGFIEPPADADIPLPASDSIIESGQSAEDYETFAKLEPGMFPVVPVDGRITIANPKEVGDTYEPFIESLQREIAAAIGVTYEGMTGNLSGVNYSSIRAGLVKFRRACRMMQENLVIFQWSRPVWKAFIEACVFAGHISAEDYAANQREYLNVVWRFPKWEWVDPLKDVQADIKEVEAGLASRSEKIAERGRSAEEVDEEIRRDQEREKKLGIEIGSSGSEAVPGATDEPRKTE